MKVIFACFFLLGNISSLLAQKVGINTTTPTAALDVSGDMILKSGVLILPDGVLYDIDVITNRYNYYQLTGPTGNFVISGILAAV